MYEKFCDTFINMNNSLTWKLSQGCYDLCDINTIHANNLICFLFYAAEAENSTITLHYSMMEISHISRYENALIPSYILIP